jgi:hypothetical protein
MRSILPARVSEDWRSRSGEALHGKSPKIVKRGHRLVKPGQACRVFKVKIVPGFRIHKMAGTCCLAALPGSNESHNAMSAKAHPNFVVQSVAFQHGEI